MRKALLAASLAIAVAGCGGTNKRLDPAVFRAKTDAVCREAQADAAKIESPKVDPTSPAISDAVLKRWAEPLRQLVKRYRTEAEGSTRLLHELGDACAQTPRRLPPSSGHSAPMR